METDITGIGKINVQYSEYTHTEVLKKFTQFMRVINGVFIKTTPIVKEDYDILVINIKNLADLAKNGIQQGSGDESYVAGLDSKMANLLEEVMRSFIPFEVTSDSSLLIPDAEKIQIIKAWKSLGGFIGLNEILIEAAALETLASTGGVDPKTGNTIVLSPTKTVQSMLELEYVKTSNDLIFSRLDSLEKALDISVKALSSLAVVQQIANRIDVLQKPPFTLPAFSANPPLNLTALRDIKFANDYQAAASAYFNQIAPVVQNIDTTAYELWTAKRDLSTQYTALLAIGADTSTNSLTSNLIRVMADISARFTGFAPNTLYSILTPSGFGVFFNDEVKKWIMDGLDATVDDTGQQGTAGQIQGRISTAIRVAENLNDKQRDAVKRYMNIFEEFYKSAAVMLERLTSAIEKMGKKITRS